MKIKLFTIPNLLTLSNLFCGSAAVVSALVWGDLKLAFGLMVLAAVFDFFDGFAARLLNQSSPIGLQLDSLADDISFGLAPAAAMLCGSLGLLFETSGLELPREAISAIAVVVGLLMISNLRMFALKFHGFGWKGNELRYGFIIAAVVTAVLLRGYAVPAIIVLYILVSLVRGLACRTKGCGKAE